jgi:ankyrin repeat protein
MTPSTRSAAPASADCAGAQTPPLARREELDAALWDASVLGDIPLVRSLVELGAKSSPRGTGLRAAFSVAIQADFLEMAKALRPAADVNEADCDGATPLMIAALARNDHLVAFLLENGADPLLVDNKGRSALSHAALMGDISCVRLLLPVSDPAATDFSGNDALQLAAGSMPGEDKLRLLAFLLTRCAPKSQNRSGGTALMRAIALGDERAARLLADVSDLSARTDAGQCAADAALSFGMPDLAAELRARQDRKELAAMLATAVRLSGARQTSGSVSASSGEPASDSALPAGSALRL